MNLLEFRRLWGGAVVAILITGRCLGADTSTNILRIGTFDSRAVAIAYANSPAHQEILKDIQARLEAARKANDSKKAKSLEGQMRARQRLLHQQGFSTGSVMNILEPFKPELTRIAREAGINLIASRWELPYTSDRVESIDITPQIVKLFNPSEKAMKWIESSRSKPPIPIDDLPDDLQ